MNPTTEAFVEKMVASSPFSRRIGTVIDVLEPQRAVFRVPFSTDNVTAGDLVHGGAIAALIDVAATGAAWSGIEDVTKCRGTTVGLSVSYLTAARGTDLTAEARVRQRGRTVCFVDVVIRDTEGQEVATAQVIYKLSGAEAAGDEGRTPAETLGALFAGRSTEEQRILLAALERGGATLYSQWARDAETDADRRALEAAASRELENADLLDRLPQRKTS